LIHLHREAFGGLPDIEFAGHDIGDKPGAVFTEEGDFAFSLSNHSLNRGQFTLPIIRDRFLLLTCPRSAVRFVPSSLCSTISNEGWVEKRLLLWRVEPPKFEQVTFLVLFLVGSWEPQSIL